MILSRSEYSIPSRRVIHVVTAPVSLIFVERHLPYLRQNGWEVEFVSGSSDNHKELERRYGVPIHQIPMCREPAPYQDVYSLLALTDLFMRRRPAIVHAQTPKAGLLGTLAAKTAAVPHVIYHMRGFIADSATGLLHKTLLKTEKLSCSAADIVLSVGESLRRRAIEANVVDPSKIHLIHYGSNGINTTLFSPDAWRDESYYVRKQLNIPQDAIVVGCIARLVKQKGIEELLTAWKRVSQAYPLAHLLLVGPYESRDSISDRAKREIENTPNIHHVPFQNVTQPYYGAMDIFVLPSHREGFSNVLLEASSMGLPCVTTTAVGCTDPIVNGLTATAVPINDPESLEKAISNYISSPLLRYTHGTYARLNVIEKFRLEDVSKQLLCLYNRLYDGQNGE